MPFPLVGAIAGLAKTFLPKLLPAIGGLFGGAARAAPPTLVRALPSVTAGVQRGIQLAQPALRRALPVLRRGGAIAGAGAAFEAGSRLVGGQRGISIRVGRDGQQMVVARGRRMNPANVRALRRAIRRVKRFERLARRVGSFVGAGGYRLKGFRRRPRRRWGRYRGDAPIWQEQEPGLWQPYDLDEPEAYDGYGEEAENGD